MNLSNKLSLFPIFLALSIDVGLAEQPTSSSTRFMLLPAETGAAGGSSISATYSADTATGSAIAGGVSNVSAGGVQSKDGYTGQLYDGISMVLAAAPSSTVNAGESTQVSATVTLDDATTLATSSLAWETVSGPFVGIDADGNFTTGYPNTPSTARVRGTYDLLVETIDLDIVPAAVDPYTFSLDELGGTGGPYEVRFGTSPDALTSTTVGGSRFDPGALTPGTTYYWEVFDGANNNITPGGDGPVRFLAGAEVELVQIGHPGNAPDATGFGAVSDKYWMGTLEITNRQYADFLNAVAGTDTNTLFDPQMESAIAGGIRRFGASGGYTYAPKDKMAEKPVNFLSFWSACRYCNWLHNSMPNGAQTALTTESGAYDLTDPGAITANTVVRSPDANYFIPDNDEWDKAAYHDPRTAAQMGPPGDTHYWLYPTVSDTIPTAATAATADSDGNIDNDTDPIANFNSTADWNGKTGNVTTVGSGGTGSESYYGIRDMAGNLSEMLEDIDGTNRSTRGGAFDSAATVLASTDAVGNRLFPAATGAETTGFRIAALADPDPVVVKPSAVLPAPVNTALKISYEKKLKKLKKKLKKAKKTRNAAKGKKFKGQFKALKKKIAAL